MSCPRERHGNNHESAERPKAASTRNGPSPPRDEMLEVGLVVTGHPHEGEAHPLGVEERRTRQSPPQRSSHRRLANAKQSVDQDVHLKASHSARRVATRRCGWWSIVSWAVVADVLSVDRHEFSPLTKWICRRLVGHPAPIQETF